ncbi:hypothetical protein [Roseovarius ramblicola]|uniref:DUF2917 domain-containing protein n=1 Tax=Roseovarius ramblicola TaxID=2022336 RepID=A0ABV5I2E3_9RHOB
MLGLVLWCDGATRRALIWCEDQGDLAWYEAGREEAAPVGAGDLVYVEVSAARGLRRAQGLRLVARGVAWDLPRQVSRAATG